MPAKKESAKLARNPLRARAGDRRPKIAKELSDTQRLILGEITALPDDAVWTESNPGDVPRWSPPQPLAAIGVQPDDDGLVRTISQDAALGGGFAR